jgi:hypothetical protein
MARETLFDSGLRYGGPALCTEPHFAFLNRADGPAWQRVREVLEAWYSEHPDPNNGLRARFREHDIHQHAPAWWELYCYTLFRRLGYEVTADPTIPGTMGRPDLLVTKHYTMVAAVSALVTSNLFLIVELSQPYIGEISTSPEPLRAVIQVLSPPA